MCGLSEESRRTARLGQKQLTELTCRGLFGGATAGAASAGALLGESESYSGQVTSRTTTEPGDTTWDSYNFEDRCSLDLLVIFQVLKNEETNEPIKYIHLWI